MDGGSDYKNLYPCQYRLVFDMAVSFSAALVMMKETFTKMSMSQFTGTAFLELGMGRRDFLIVLAGCIIIFIVSLLKERGWQSGRQLRQSRSLSAGQYGMRLLSLFLFLPIQVMVQHLFTRTSDITIHKRRRGSMIHMNLYHGCCFLCVTL